MSYQLNSYVNRQEAEALKEMIFKRARERAKAMTGDVKADVMDIARESFVSNNNPFSQILTQTKTSQTVSEVQKAEKYEETNDPALKELVEKVEQAQGQNQIGFPQKNLFAGINQNRIIKEQLTASQIQNNMIEARQELSNKKSFMGALEFLNSQAAVSLMNRRGSKGVDIVA